MKYLLDEFEEASRYRKALRRKIMKILREHKEYFRAKGYNSLLRKMGWNYLGDLSDPKLIMYLKVLIRAEERIEENKEEQYTFSEDNIVF